MLCILFSVSLQAQNTCEETPVPPGTDEFTLNHLSSYATGVFDEAAAEIVAYDVTSQRLFFTNANDNTVTILSIADPANPTKVMDVDMSPFGGGINSVAVHNGLIAAAVQAETVDGNGTVVLFDADGTIISTATVGVLPDMVTFAQNGSKLITANEGEPSDDYLTDPLGSVSIIDLSAGTTNPLVTTVDFTAYDGRRQELINKGVRLFGPNASVSQDLEPEYITVADDSIAYVSLQENNAFALININTGAIVDIQALGYKNHATGQPKLTEYVLNELIDMPDLGTPTYGGGQPTVKLGGFSGMYFDAAASTATDYVFYAVPDRGPNDGAVNRNNVVGGNPTNLRPFKLPDYQGRIAKFTLNIMTGAVTLDEQILLTRADGTTPITGRGNIPGFDETPVVPADPASANVEVLNVDFEDGNLAPFVAVDVASNREWGIANFSGNDNYAEINGFGGDVASNDWLVSPAIDLVNATGTTLSFESTANFDGPDLKVLVSSDYDPVTENTGTAIWTDITSQATLSPGNNADTPSGDIDLSDFEGQVVFLAFQYISTGTGGGDGKRWQVDDIIVQADAPPSDFVDTDGNLYDALPFDEFGGDFESIVRDGNGNFWMCDEYRPAIYAFTPTGVLINRFVPAGTSMLGTTPQPAGTYGSETLPAVYAKRRANRGFEGMALNTDDGLLYAFIQTPLYNPDNSTRNASDVIRVLAVNPATGSAEAEYVYLLENNANRAYDIGRVDKIGDVVYAGNGKFMVLERDSSVPGQDEGKKYVFEFTLTGATNILSLPISTADGTSGPALETLSADELVAAGVTPLHKTKVLNLPSIGYLPSDKPEGIAILPSGAIAVLNDNDFGLAGAGVSDNSTLGIIDFCGDNGFDASNRDGVINITTHPTLGMYQPDAIASYSVGDATYIVSANEGDARDYDAFSEETRVGDLTLDPMAYPDAAALQEDDNLGRLRTTDATGDIDGDGDIDQIYSYGARSFSIWDRYGNLVFDSGNEFERILADLIPDDFNSSNDENDGFDNRSDDKGPEPEAVEVFTKGDKIFALIGLERVGGIMVYDITDPRAPSYVSYVNNRNFDVEAQLADDSSNPAAGDLGVEDVIYISAEQSPDGMELVVTSNEVSGTVSLFGVNRVIDNCPVVPPTPEGETGFELNLISSYATGVFDEAAAEIVAHDPVSQRLFFTNANDNSVGILDIADPADPMLVSEISMAPFGGGINSVAVSGGIVAVAVQGNETADAGTVVFLDSDGMVAGSVAVGILPDMVTFTPDGTKVLTANEGEPNDDYNVDPEGSVSIVDLSGGTAAATATTVDFTMFNDSLDVLLEAGVRIFGPNATVAQDLEPEYITTDDNTAYVVFQENNAIGVIDLATESLTAIHALGFKDHACDINGFDASNRDDALNIAGRPVLGMYMPDAMTSYTVDGTTYLVTANEGDARDYDGFSEESRVGDLTLDPTAYPNATALQDDANLGRLLSTIANGDTDGDGDVDQIYSYGARSFSIFSTTGELVYDSGSEFERIIADRLRRFQQQQRRERQL